MLRQLRRYLQLIARDGVLSGRYLHDLRRIAIEEHLDQGGASTNNPLVANAHSYWSQSNEDGIIEHIFDRVGTAGDRGTFVEFGVGDGTENNSLALMSKNWFGEWFGGEPLLTEPPPNGRLRFNRCWVTRDNIVELARSALTRIGVGPEQLDLLSLDLDGNDYWLTEALLEAGIRPRVWVAEYNARFPVGSQWVMPYDAKHRWNNDDYYGASLTALCLLFGRFGYVPVACSAHGANVLLVRGDLRGSFTDVPSELADLYRPPRYFMATPRSHPVSARTLNSIFSA